MKANDGDRADACPCHKLCKDGPAGFEKIMDLEKLGLVIYRHKIETDNENLATAVQDTKSIPNTITAENVLILLNKKDVDITSKNFLPEMEKRVTCTRCRHIMEHALKVLQKVQTINRHAIMSICDHCKLEQQFCKQCDETVKKFNRGKYEANHFFSTKENVREWLTKVKSLLKDSSLGEKIKNHEKGRVNSDLQNDQFCGRKYAISENHLTISELNSETKRPELTRTSSAITDKNKHFFFKLDVLHRGASDSLMTLEDSSKLKSKFVRTFLTNENQGAPLISKHEEKVEKELKSLQSGIDFSMQGKDNFVKYDRSALLFDQKRRKDSEDDIVTANLYRHNTHSMEKDLVFAPKPIHELNINSEKIKRSQVYKVKEGQSKKPVPSHEQYVGEDFFKKTLSHTTIAESQNEKLEKGFSFSFPKEIVVEKHTKRLKSSSELIEDIQGKLQAKNANAKKKNDEKHFLKFEGEQNKQLSQKERLKVSAEKNKRAQQLTEEKEYKILKNELRRKQEDANLPEKKQKEADEIDHNEERVTLIASTDNTKSKASKPKSETKEFKPKSELNILKPELKKPASKDEENKIEKTGPKSASKEPTIYSKEIKVDSNKPKVDAKQPNIEPKEHKDGQKESRDGEKVPKIEPKKPQTGPNETSIRSKGTQDKQQDGSKNPKNVLKEPNIELNEPSVASKETKSGLKDPTVIPKKPKDEKDEPQVGPKHPHDGPKDSSVGSNDPKIGLKEPKIGPKEPKEGFKEPKEGLKEPKEGHKEPKIGPKEAKEGFKEPKEGLKEPKIGPKGPKEGFKEPKEGLKEPKIGPKDPKEGFKEPKEGLKESTLESKEQKPEHKKLKSEPKEAKLDSIESKKESKESDLRKKGKEEESKFESKLNKSELRKSKSESKSFKSELKELPKSKGSESETYNSKLDKDTSKAEKDSETGIKQHKSKNSERNLLKQIKQDKSQLPQENRVELGGKSPKTKNVPFVEDHRIPRRLLEVKSTKEDSAPAKEEKKKLPKRNVSLTDRTKYKMLSPSQNYMVLELVRLKESTKVKKRTLSQIITPIEIMRHSQFHKSLKDNKCPMCISSDLELEYECKTNKIVKPKELQDIIEMEKISKYNKHTTDKINLKDEENEAKGLIKPILFKTTFNVSPRIDNAQVFESSPTSIDTKIPPAKILSSKGDQEPGKGVIQYALSDRTFIEKGWTMLPTEKIVRKMNVYRMRPAHPEFDWFNHNKNKRLMHYDTGERLAEFDDNGRGRWYYKNERLALEYYDAEELNAQQRYVIYSNGEPDERGRPRPYTVLATFDYLGNGIVFDHSGKIRLKYNQTEGVVLDRNIGPVSHWKWHTLNDPPVLQQVMIDTQMAHKDPQILKMGGPTEKKTRPDNEEMLAIEFDNFIKEKSKKLTQSFKPFQIKMKALKINEHFSLKVLDQANVYLIYRDGTTNLKLNIGMLLDNKEIVDTDTAEVGEVSNNIERLPARTDSIAGLQKCVAYAQRFEKARLTRERRLCPPQSDDSVEKLTAATSRPMRHPLHTVRSTITTTTNCCCKSRKPASSIVYYDNRF